jgi:hypothetical protein
VTSLVLISHEAAQGRGQECSCGVIGVLILKRKFAMVGESEPIVITNTGVCGSIPLRQYCTGARPWPFFCSCSREVDKLDHGVDRLLGSCPV